MAVRVAGGAALNNVFENIQSEIFDRDVLEDPVKPVSHNLKTLQ